MKNPAKKISAPAALPEMSFRMGGARVLLSQALPDGGSDFGVEIQAVTTLSTLGELTLHVVRNVTRIGHPMRTYDLGTLSLLIPDEIAATVALVIEALQTLPQLQAASKMAARP